MDLSDFALVMGCAAHGRRALLQSGVGRYAGTELRQDRDDDIVFGPMG